MTKELSSDNGFLRKDNNGFYLDPIVGAERIDCDIFDKSLLELAIKNVGQYVTIHGEFYYRKNDRFPFKCRISELEIMPNERYLPTLYDLHGVIKDFPKGLTSEEFVRNMRDNEW
ncbi:hypothetical protein KY334_07125 [Candidatus Woesearchaeota archaeon]|nr:hypothetical protein [Candidatus Woesearchaeota archaeon]